MKSKKLVNIFAIIVVIAVVAFAGFFVKSNATVDCAGCGGEGQRFQVICHECEGAGDECTSCEGAGGVGDMIACADCEGAGQVPADNNYYSTFVSLLPPVIAIALALITKEVYSSLFIGVAVGGLFAANFKPITAIDHIMNDGVIAAAADTAGIFVFLVVLGVLVALVNKAGGSAAFGKWAAKHIKSKVGAAFATFVLGVLIFIDDYFNCLTVGSVMRPVTDKHKISRAKLSYLIDATAAPVCMIAPISSWAAAVSEYAGQGNDGLALFVQAIPYNFYSLLTFVFIIAITLMKFDYGPMRVHELNAERGDLFTTGQGEGQEEEVPNSKGKVIDLLLPIIVLIAICVFALVYVGGIFDGLGFIDAFGNTDATVGLPWGAVIALIITVVYLIARRTITFKEAMECIPKGFIAMVPAILILTLAASLKNVNGLLGSDAFVENMLGSAGALHNFLPAIIFLVAVGISFATGTSWGTFGILIPIVLAIFPVGSELGIIGMSACLAGSVCGDHCSPISDTTIMSSAGAQCNHLNHVSTQLPYAITVAAVSFAAYIVAGFVQNWIIVLPLFAVVMVAVLFVIKAVTKKAAN
ncbi:MAG: Na+/H+ antiporter NhaC family protein [Ruminococcaceae bacterium]|nr:Na+/H+ antiporter NhaC family protein [Oscillospiraceae bacterium]